jgi:hypothetical protein
MTLLDQVERKEISVPEAASKIKASLNSPDSTLTLVSKSETPAKWLKIKIVDPESNFRMSLPPLPLRLTGKLASFILKVSMRHTGNSDLVTLDYEDIRLMLDTLKELPPVHLVSVSDDHGTQIEIFTK